MSAVRDAVDRFFNRVWYEHTPWASLIVPFGWLFACGIFARRTLYRLGLLPSRAAGCPVIVVGNITAGGTGKTPVTIWLAENLKSRGLKPGIVSRGYGGRVGSVPVHVTDDSDPAIVGDEPLLMARRIVCPVAVHPDRVAAAGLLADLGCDVIVADDGLQHYRLQRDFEIAVVDGRRGFGNRRLLPAGPLREPVARLQTVNRIMVQGSGRDCLALQGGDFPEVTRFELTARSVHNLGSRPPVTLEAFRGKSVHAVAAIGNPRRFFDLLQEHGIDVVPHVLTDHAALTPADLQFDDRLAVLMTEKDGVKCGGFGLRNCWYVTVDLALPADADTSWIDSLVRQVKPGQ